MKKMMLAMMLISTLTFADGDGLFWSARLTGGQVEFYRSDVSTPGAATWKRSGVPIKYLKIESGEVQYMSSLERAAVDQAEADAIAAAQAAAAQAASNAAAAQAQAVLDWAAYCTSNPATVDQSVAYPTNRGPLIVGSDGKLYQLVVDTVSKEWLAVKRKDMEYLSDDSFYAIYTNSLAVNDLHRETITAAITDLAAVTNTLDQIDVSASSSYATNIAATTGATKTALQKTRTILVDMRSVVANLEQACSKIVREIK